MEQLEKFIGQGEEILWKGRPNKKCFIFECIFNPLLFVALIWLAFDMVLMFGFKIFDENDQKLFLVFFFLIHLMPVWLYLFGAIFSFLAYRRISYIITNRAIYYSRGIFTFTYEIKTFMEISNITIHKGIFDQIFKVGDVTVNVNYATTNQNRGSQLNRNKYSIINIPDYNEVYQLILKLQRDNFSDTMYPNQYRPENNPGYKTKYNPFNKDNKKD